MLEHDAYELSLTLEDIRQWTPPEKARNLWLPSAEMAVARVANRVKQGGHNVPLDDIRRRYATGVRNLFRLYRPILDGWWLYDASRLPPKLIASKEGKQMTVKQKRLYGRIERQAEESHEEGN